MTYNKEWYIKYAKKNREKINEYHKKWSKENRDKRNRYEKNWKKENKEIIKLIKHKHYLKHKKEIIEKVRKYRAKNHDKSLAKRKEISNRNKVERKRLSELTKEKRRLSLKETRKKYALKNKEYLDECRRINNRKRRLTDVNYRINSNLSSDIWHALKKNKNGKKWQTLVGYNVKELREHLEKQFNKFMSWDNYAKYWEIDHIKPRSLFKFDNHFDKEFKECWSLNNLQPLEKSKNRIKRNKYGTIPTSK